MTRPAGGAAVGVEAQEAGMVGWGWLLDVVVVVLLAVTLFHAVRLERALGTVRRDRAALAEMLEGFDASTRQAESGIDRLRGLADGAGRQIAKEVQAATALRDDLAFLIERGERLADRVDGLIRAGRAAEAPQAPEPVAADVGPKVRSQAERDLLAALKVAR